MNAPTSQSESNSLFRALADQTRQRLLQVLMLEELNVSELVEVLGLPQSTVSRHLRVLREAELVRDRPNGTAVLYSAMEPSEHNKDDGRGGSLAGMVLNWLSGQPRPAPLDDRLQRLRRQRSSTGTAFFNRIGKKWDDLRAEAFGRAFAIEALTALLPHDWTVADIGAGTGNLLQVLSTNFRRIIAIEPAEAMVACCRDRIVEQRASNVALLRGDLTRVPMADGSCDLALAILVIHHVSRPDEALCEMHRVVRPGGRVLIVEQEAHENQQFYERMQDLWWGFAPDELSGKLAEAGWRGVRQQLLTTPRDVAGAADAPRLFALTAVRGE